MWYVNPFFEGIASVGTDGFILTMWYVNFEKEVNSELDALKFYINYVVSI